MGLGGGLGGRGWRRRKRKGQSAAPHPSGAFVFRYPVVLSAKKCFRIRNALMRAGVGVQATWLGLGASNHLLRNILPIGAQRPAPPQRLTAPRREV